MDIYVGNLPYSATEEEISELFSSYGPVSRVKIITDRETGRSKGFGFVTLGDQNQLNAAIEGVNGQDFHGRALKVNASEPRPPRSGGDSRGDSRGGGEQRGGFRGERRQQDKRYDDDRPGFGKDGRGEKRRDHRDSRRGNNRKGGGGYGEW